MTGSLDSATTSRADIGYFVNKAVLVVEDEPFLAIDIALTFEGEGARTLHATNCAQAERAIAAVGGPNGLIGAVLDVRLGNNETVRPIAELLAQAGVPIVLHTFMNPREAREMTGVEAMQITKPASPSALISALRQAAQAKAQVHTEELMH